MKVAKKDIPVVYAKNRKELRKWFEKNYQKYNALWFVMIKKERKMPCASYEEIVEEALCFGFIDSRKKRLDDIKSVIYVSERKPKSVWSNSNKMRVEKLMQENKLTEAGLEKIKIAKQNGSWDAISSSENYMMPVDLKKQLSKNKMAMKYFELFPPGVKKQIYQWIISAKTEQT